MKVDTRRIFTVLISGSTIKMEQPTSEWPRLWRVGQSADLRWIIDEEWGAEAGNMAVSGQSVGTSPAATMLTSSQSAVHRLSKVSYVGFSELRSMTYNSTPLCSRWTKLQRVV